MRRMLKVMKREVEKWTKKFPGTFLIWSEMIKRRSWRNARDPVSLDKSRQKINQQLANFVRKLGFVRYKEFEPVGADDFFGILRAKTSPAMDEDQGHPMKNGTMCGNVTGDCYQSVKVGGWEVVIIPIIFGLIFLLGIIGNTLVMIVIGRIKSRRSRSTTNTFIVNLSIADLSFLFFCVPFQATIYSLPEWVFGAFFCKFVHYFVMVSMLVSIFTLAAMSVDRYIAVVHAKRSHCIRNKKNASIGVGVIWMLSFVIAIPVAQHQSLVTRHPEAPNSTFCWEQWGDNYTAKETYKVTILIIGYLLPLVMITCCYAKVLYHLHKKVKNMSKKSERSKRKAFVFQALCASVLGISGCQGLLGAPYASMLSIEL
ncbi:galanin receptor type 1-like [Discoglossus pictus]